MSLRGKEARTTGAGTISAHDLTLALGGRWAGSYGSAPCPAHEDRSPSLSLRDGDRGVLVTCHAGCTREAVIDALRGRGLWDAPRSAVMPMQRPKAPPKPETHGEPLRHWQAARDPRGTVVEAYLRSRGLDLPNDVAGRVLRYHPRLWHEESQSSWPGMVALITDLRSDRPLGTHRTFLAPDGSGKAPVKPPKKMLGGARGGAIKISAGDEVELGLVVGEGIETALAARQLGLRPVWALGSAGAISSLLVLPGVEGLTIVGEADEANARAVRECARRWVTADVDVSVLEPVGGGDANDVLLRRVA